MLAGVSVGNSGPARVGGGGNSGGVAFLVISKRLWKMLFSSFYFQVLVVRLNKNTTDN